MKLAKCKWCGANPALEQPFKDKGSALWAVSCKCGAHSWPRETKEQAATIWGGDSKGNGYHQMK